MRLAIFACIAVSALFSVLAPAWQNEAKQSGSLFVGTWLAEDRKKSGLKVKISDMAGNLRIQVWYLGTYGEYKPWPHESTLVTFRNDSRTMRNGFCAMASWRIDDAWYETWILKPEKHRLRIEIYRKFTDGRPNVSRVEYFKRSK